jgi:hypothetical protein
VLLIWPPDDTRQLVLTLLLIASAGVGLEALKRKTAKEFAGAKQGDWMAGMRKRARRKTAQTGRRIGSAMRELTDGDGDRDPEDAKLERLEKLGELKKKGVLTATEFREEKKKVLSG